MFLRDLALVAAITLVATSVHASGSDDNALPLDSVVGSKCGGKSPVPCGSGHFCWKPKPKSDEGICSPFADVNEACDTHGVRYPPRCRTEAKCIFPKTSGSLVGKSG